MDNKTIYVLEDNESLNQLFVFRLKNKEKYKVKGFFNGESFLKAVKNKKPDLVIVDLILPTITGEEVIRTLRNEYGRDLLIITVTAKTLTKDIANVFNIGVDDYIKKPVDVKELIIRIESLFKKHEELKKECEEKVEDAKEENNKTKTKRK